MFTFTELVKKSISNINAISEEIRAQTVSTLETTIYPTLEKIEAGNFEALQKDFTDRITSFNPIAVTQSYLDTVQRLVSAASK